MPEYNAADIAPARMNNQQPRPCTARFWAFINDSYVKLSIKPQQPLHHSKTYWNGEGWTTERHHWRNDGTTLTHAACTSGSDCDGYMSTGYEEEADTISPQVNFDGDTYLMPEYRKTDSYRRDAAAEAAGY